MHSISQSFISRTSKGPPENVNLFMHMLNGPISPAVPSCISGNKQAASHSRAIQQSKLTLANKDDDNKRQKHYYFKKKITANVLEDRKAKNISIFNHPK